MRLQVKPACALLLLPLLAACGGGGEEGERGGPGAAGRGGAVFASFGGDAAEAAVPVEVASVERRSIADYIETNGTLEAENEVDIVSRITGPIVELNVEEGMAVKEGQVLARIDADEILAQLGIARVTLEEARLALERAKVSWENEIISRELLDQAQSRYDAAAAQVRGTEIMLGYTEITAPFGGLVVERYVKFAEHVTTNQKLFRLSDFTPLLCPIKIPEKDLEKLRIGQRAYLTVEAFPEERFPAKVLRISPVVDAATGTVEVTLDAEARGRLRPGMFASVFLETDVHHDALVMSKSALVLESIGDTVYVMADGQADRREVELGFEEAAAVEVLSGVSEGEQVIVIGQDGLTDGTPVYVLSERVTPPAPMKQEAGDAPSPAAGKRPSPGRSPGSPPGGPGSFDPANLTPERIERIKERMRQFGLTEEQIEQRIQQMKDGNFVPPNRRGGPPAN